MNPSQNQEAAAAKVEAARGQTIMASPEASADLGAAVKASARPQYKKRRKLFASTKSQSHYDEHSFISYEVAIAAEEQSDDVPEHLRAIIPPHLNRVRTAEVVAVQDLSEDNMASSRKLNKVMPLPPHEEEEDRLSPKGNQLHTIPEGSSRTNQVDAGPSRGVTFSTEMEDVSGIPSAAASPSPNREERQALLQVSTGPASSRLRQMSFDRDYLGHPHEVTPFLLKRSQQQRYSFRTRRDRGLQRLASMPGDSELNDYMDSLAKDPEKFTTPQNSDTGETILHLLAKEGKVEILRNLLDDTRVEKELVAALLMQDKLGWSPIMACTKADSGVEDMAEMFLTFLEPRLEESQLGKVIEDENIAKDTIFTLLMRNNELYQPARAILFRILQRYTTDSAEVNRYILCMLNQLSTPNSCELTSRTMKELIDLSDEIEVQFEELFSVQDSDGNNLLMELAKNMKDDALREILTNYKTSNFITHSILAHKNHLGQTLLCLIEVNREMLSESLPLVLKREYGCHRWDMIKTELCLAQQLETSASASEIIQELHQLEPKSWCQILLIWMTLFLTSLTPNIVLAFGDIFSDAYLVVEYHSNMINASYMAQHEEECERLTEQQPYPLQAYASCLDARSQFWYTITFLLIPLIFYTTEFLTLRPEYEPTGLRNKLISLWTALKVKKKPCKYYLTTLFSLLTYLFLTVVALILWQPVTAIFKFYRDGRYEASEGQKKVDCRKEKRFTDLAASRGELIEVSIEAVFEPMVQGYIIFPSIISIIQRLANSVTVADDGTVRIDFALKGIETAQIFSIGVSMVSLAWCFSEYNSVRKNMLLDITVSPCSRIIMCLFMLFQVIARLLAFMLFTLFWGPGNFYPLMVFVLIHMIISGGLHIVFSEDIVFLRKGLYLKFFHNVMMNSFATIYFHNYLRFDEMPVTAKKYQVEAAGSDPDLAEAGMGKLNKSTSSVEFVDAQRPGLHISTFLRQTMFDILYNLEYVVLLAFGFSSEVQDLIDQKTKPIFISVILGLSFLALGLKLFYYMVMHVWNNVIISGKKLVKRDFNHHDGSTHDDSMGRKNFHSRFFKYVFISRNTWVLGRLKHIETTLIVLPKRIIEAIKGRGQDLEYNFTDVTRQVDRSWFSSPKEFLAKLKPNNLILSLLFFPLVVLVIVINLLIIALLLVGLVLTIPVAVLIFLYNLKSGFRAVEIKDFEEEGNNTLELPPEVDRGETTIFNSDPSRTLVTFQKDLEEHGRIDLSRKVDYSADEFEVFAMLLLSLNRKKYPLRLLILDNCDITDEKLIKLSPLIAKFEKVSLNGSQKMSSHGWEHVASTLTSPQTHSKLRSLELKIAKNDDEMIRFRREVLLEELKGSSMTGEALSKIAAFVPRLEKVFLDDIYNDTNILDFMKGRSEGIVEAWKEMKRSFTSCPIAKRKLRCLSLPGCSINDEILMILAPALVRIKKVILGRNPITSNGWKHFKNAFLDALSSNEVALTHLSVSNIADSTSNKSMIHNTGMEHLATIIPKLEEVDLSGQSEITADGWNLLSQKLLQAYDKGFPYLKLKTLVVSQCKIKPDARTSLDETAAKCAAATNLKLEYGSSDQADGSRRRRKATGILFCW